MFLRPFIYVVCYAFMYVHAQICLYLYLCYDVPYGSLIILI